LERPKLLGLTASPAGKATVEQTVNMLKELMSNVGDAKIEIVEENQDELDIYRSNAEIEIQTVSLNTTLSFIFRSGALQSFIVIPLNGITLKINLSSKFKICLVITVHQLL
jgi:ERCC4-related helicase